MVNYEVKDGELIIRVRCDPETCRIAPLSSTGETRLLAGGGGIVSIATPEGHTLSVRPLVYFNALDEHQATNTPVRVAEACRAMIAKNKSADKTALATATLERLEQQEKARKDGDERRKNAA